MLKVVRDVSVEIICSCLLMCTSALSGGKDCIDLIVHLCEEEILEFF
jgi:hypothetical protein